MNSESVEDSADSGVPELQAVLTRYMDSSRGYMQAARLMERPGYSAAFAEIAARRGEVAHEIAAMIQREGEHPEQTASTEGALHRWWIRLRDTLSNEELEAVLEECVRGEKVLLAALEKALDSQDLTAEQAAILRRARNEVTEAIQHFKIALDE